MPARRRPAKSVAPAEIETLATPMAADFQRLLVRDGTVAGYTIFEPDGMSQSFSSTRLTAAPGFTTRSCR